MLHRSTSSNIHLISSTSNSNKLKTIVWKFFSDSKLNLLMQCARMLSISLKIQYEAKCVWQRWRRLPVCEGSFWNIQETSPWHRGVHLNNPFSKPFSSYSYILNTKSLDGWKVYPVAIAIPFTRHKPLGFKNSHIPTTPMTHKNDYLKKMACRSSVAGVWNVHNSSYNTRKQVAHFCSDLNTHLRIICH